MAIIDAFIGELQHEAVSTRQALARIPAEEFNFKPHPKCFPMGALASHMVNILGWLRDTLETPELVIDPSTYKGWEGTTPSELLERWDTELEKTISAMKGITDEHLAQSWKLRSPDKVFLEMPRLQVLRGMILNHLVHHRAQLGLYLRLKDIPVPAMYGPSADEGAMG